MDDVTILKMAPHLMEAVHAGNKLVTIRYSWRNIYPGPAVIVNADDETDCCGIVISAVLLTHAVGIPSYYVKLDGFITHEEMVEGLRQYYPDFVPGSPVTVVEWVPASWYQEV